MPNKKNQVKTKKKVEPPKRVTVLAKYWSQDPAKRIAIYPDPVLDADESTISVLESSATPVVGCFVLAEKWRQGIAIQVNLVGYYSQPWQNWPKVCVVRVSNYLEVVRRNKSEERRLEKQISSQLSSDQGVPVSHERDLLPQLVENGSAADPKSVLDEDSPEAFDDLNSAWNGSIQNPFYSGYAKNNIQSSSHGFEQTFHSDQNREYHFPHFQLTKSGVLDANYHDGDKVEDFGGEVGYSVFYETAERTDSSRIIFPAEDIDQLFDTEAESLVEPFNVSEDDWHLKDSVFLSTLSFFSAPDGTDDADAHEGPMVAQPTSKTCNKKI
jgi:hypothetical protein